MLAITVQVFAIRSPNIGSMYAYIPKYEKKIWQKQTLLLMKFQNIKWVFVPVYEEPGCLKHFL